MADMMCPEDVAYTANQIVDMVATQKSEKALDHWRKDNEPLNRWASMDEARRLCLSCIIRRFRDDDGKEYVFDGQKQNAVVVRVSLRRMRSVRKGKARLDDIDDLDEKGMQGELDDGGIGWRDQIAIVLRAAIADSKKTGCPIRVYNDGGFSGTLPPDDPTMIKEMRLTRAEVYRVPFQEVVVDRIEASQEKEDVARFLKRRVAAISGVEDTSQALKDDPDVARIIAPDPQDRSFGEVEAKLKLRYNVHKNYNGFRPAFHFLLMDLPVIHAIFVYDVDRLSRDYALSEVLSRRLANTGIEVKACTADAGYVTAQNYEATILRAVFLGRAAEFVRSNMRQILRSHFAALSAGRPISDIPIWLKRDEFKKITWKREYLPLVEAALRAWMDVDNYKGHRQISTAVNAVMRQYNEGIDNPKHILKPKRSESGVFSEPSVRYWLCSPMIYGCIQQWGRSWPLAAGEDVDAYQSPLLHPDDDEIVSPLALISQKQWERTQRLRIAAHPTKRGRTTTNKRALSGLLKCRCGAGMCYHGPNKDDNRDEWVCHSQPDMKRVILEKTGLKWHIGYDNGQVMDIIHGIMRETPELLRPTLGPDNELDTRHAKLVAQRDRLRAEAITRTKTAMPGLAETEDSFIRISLDIMKALGAGDVQAQVDRMEAEIFQREQQAQLPTPEEEGNFDSLSPARQNQILSSLIKEIRPVQPNGCADLRGEYLEIVKRDGVVLAPIPCVQTRILSTGLPKWHLSSFADWIASASSLPPVEAIEPAGGV
jgi:hypothetical protein